MVKKQLVKIAIIIGIPALILSSNVPEGLTSEAWNLFAIYIAVILGIILRPFSEPVVMLGILGLAGLFYNPKALLVGYASTTVWLVFSAFMISQAFIETGLGKRIAYFLVGKFGKSSLSIGYVMAFTDLILSPATPSNTARSGGITYPIFKSVAETLGSKPGETGSKIGSYLTILMYQVSLSTAVIFLTAMAPNALVANFAKDILGVTLDWVTWAKAAIVPGMVVLMLIPLIVYKLYKPEITKINSAKKISTEGLRAMEPLSISEKILSGLFVLAILGWATGKITGFGSSTVALAFLALLLLTKTVSWDSILNSKGGWNTLIWYGGIIGLSSSLAKVGFFKWLAATVQQIVNFDGVNTIVIYFVLVVVSLLVRYIFASTGAYVTTFVPVIYAIGSIANIPMMPFALLIAFATGYGALLTHYGGAVGPVLFGTGYVNQIDWWRIGAVVVGVNLLVYFVIGLPYWKILGMW
jgi:DASS family divalent anion:Na+ symporter